jgi:hypothetical protein
MTHVYEDPKSIDTDALQAALEAHRDGSGKFTRRMAIHIADLFNVRPMSAVWQLEKRGLIRRGSYEWFKDNGGITADNIKQVRTEAEADRRAALGQMTERGGS